MTQSKEIKQVRIGDFIKIFDRTNSRNLDLPVMGLNKAKQMMPTVANLDGVSLSKYKLVEKGIFVFSGMQTGRDVCIRIVLADNNNPVLVSPAYTTFKIIPENNILPEYLFLWFDREESDRYGWFISDSSVRSNLDWPRFLDIEIPVPFKDGEPDVERQKEVVDIWQGLRRLKEENEAIAKPLLDLCQAKIVDLYNYYPKKPIGEFVDFIRDKNYDCAIQLEQGINIQKEFITPQRKNSDLSGRIIVRHGQIAYCSQLNNENVAVAYRDSDDCVVSSVYRVLDLKPDKIEEIDKEYLFLHLCRKEFGRFVYWASIGSAYEFLREQNLCEWEIPIPPIEVQRAIVDIYHCARRAKAIAEEANQQLKSICPALMQYIIHSAV